MRARGRRARNTARAELLTRHVVLRFFELHVVDGARPHAPSSQAHPQLILRFAAGRSRARSPDALRGISMIDVSRRRRRRTLARRSHARLPIDRQRMPRNAWSCTHTAMAGRLRQKDKAPEFTSDQLVCSCHLQKSWADQAHDMQSPK